MSAYPERMFFKKNNPADYLTNYLTNYLINDLGITLKLPYRRSLPFSLGAASHLVCHYFDSVESNYFTSS
jgi:hypothetical protein